MEIYIGRFDRLEKAINDLKDKGTDYQFVFLGDYIDRGPQSKDCIDLLIDFRKKRPESIFLLGNHEEFVLGMYCRELLQKDSALIYETKLDISRIWANNGGNKTLACYENRMISDEHLEFIKSLNYIYQQRRLIFVHAGINKTKPLSENTTEDILWIRKPFGFKYEQQRIVVHGHSIVRKVFLDTVENSICVDTGAILDDGKLSVLEIEDNQHVLNVHEYK